MATQDLSMDFSQDDADDDDVQALLAAIKSRKEKQARIKKTIREKVAKALKVLKDEAEAQDPKLTAIHEKINKVSSSLSDLVHRAENLPAIPEDTTKADLEMLDAKRHNLRKKAEEILGYSIHAERVFRKRLHQITSLLEAEGKRSRNEEVIEGLHEMKSELDRAVTSLKGGVGIF